MRGKQQSARNQAGQLPGLKFQGLSTVPLTSQVLMFGAAFCLLSSVPLFPVNEVRAVRKGGADTKQCAVSFAGESPVQQKLEMAAKASRLVLVNLSQARRCFCALQAWGRCSAPGSGSARQGPIATACGSSGAHLSLAPSQGTQDFRHLFKEGKGDLVIETLRLDQSGSVPGSCRKCSHREIL